MPCLRRPNQVQVQQSHEALRQPFNQVCVCTNCTSALAEHLVKVPHGNAYIISKQQFAMNFFAKHRL